MHAVHIARAHPGLIYQPTDISEIARASIAAWSREAGLNNLLDPLALDVTSTHWPVDKADVIFNANMVHISPWEAAQGLMAGAGRILNEGGRLVLYGPFIVDGVETAPSNLAFDQSLKRRDPRWGIRNLKDVCALALEAGLNLESQHSMPANNLMLVFKRG